MILKQANRIIYPDECSSPDISVPPVRIYVINLDRCIDRWERLRGQAAKYALDVVRVPAIDGRSVAEEERVDFHQEQFVYRNGRTLLAGEYGCYRSHLLALEQFIASGDDMAIIVEDDVELNSRLIPRAVAAMKNGPGARLVKLISHRLVGFKAISETAEKDVIGRCLHGPQGSAACYIVNREAAQRLLVTLRPMLLPYDVALERGWSTGVETFSMLENLAAFSPYRSDTAIGKRVHYRAAKRHFLLRASAHWFRACDQFRRWAYTARTKAEPNF